MSESSYASSYPCPISSKCVPGCTASRYDEPDMQRYFHRATSVLVSGHRVSVCTVSTVSELSYRGWVRGKAHSGCILRDTDFVFTRNNRHCHHEVIIGDRVRVECVVHTFENAAPPRMQMLCDDRRW